MTTSNNVSINKDNAAAITSSITISGAPKKYDAAELEQLQAGWHVAYHQTSQSCERVRCETGHELLERVIELSAQGYTVAHHLPMSADYLSFVCYLTKPESVQAKDIEAINARVKAEYIADLQASLDGYKALLVEQLLQKSEEKERQKERAARAKMLEAAQREASDCYGSLVIPE